MGMWIDSIIFYAIVCFIAKTRAGVVSHKEQSGVSRAFLCRTGPKRRGDAMELRCSMPEAAAGGSSGGIAPRIQESFFQKGGKYHVSQEVLHSH